MRININLLRLNNISPKWSKRHRYQFEMLQSEWDADDGDAE